MATIKEFLSSDHRRCDELFANMEHIATNSLQDAKEACIEFQKRQSDTFRWKRELCF